MTSSIDQHLSAQFRRQPKALARASRSNFLKALFFLDPNQKRGLYVVYAFARVLDDAVDDWSLPKDQEKALSFWETLFEQALLGTVSGPLMSELVWAIHHFGIDPKHFRALILGCRADIAKHRYQTFAELEAYCYNVASTIGLITLPIFAIEKESNLENQCIALGKALQLTNILRDVYEDFERGRLYLPLEDLRRFNVSEEDIRQKNYTESFYQLMHFEAERADLFFNMADKFLQSPEKKGYVAPWLMGTTYAKILKNLRRKRFNVFEGKVSLSKGQKLSLLMRAFLRWPRASRKRDDEPSVVVQ